MLLYQTPNIVEPRDRCTLGSHLSQLKMHHALDAGSSHTYGTAYGRVRSMFITLAVLLPRVSNSEVYRPSVLTRAIPVACVVES